MVDDSVDSFVNLELRKTDLESYVFGEEGNIWTNLIGKVDQAYMDSCTGASSDSTMQKFCDFAKGVVSKKNDIERQSWFSDWQMINTYEEEVPGKRWLFP